ncbi:MAG TPA: ADP-glyceromanno-heptose 6-epimerase [Chitinophagaceae bacterium]|nr:ADP-glyceromanno-heptose 6-epimerase [Chitinophagaceae bacterium]
MNTGETIVVTGAAGFIGSCLVSRLNQQGYDRLILVDDFTSKEKASNLEGKTWLLQVDREDFFDWLEGDHLEIKAIFHLGARTDTTDPDYGIFEKLNLNYSRDIWGYCTHNRIPLVYASSAATYGSGESGYGDGLNGISRLLPLNPYGVSKQQFDLWAIEQPRQGRPPFWAGLKFFNVYGPNEYHKGRMASVAFHAFNQMKEAGCIRLFRSHRPDYRDGEQLRDFIYVDDVLEVCLWMMEQQRASGIYNLGTGLARTFHDLAAAVCAALHQDTCIEFVDMPGDIRNNYQYFTEAKMGKLRRLGYKKPFHTLEEGIAGYVTDYLLLGRYY